MTTVSADQASAPITQTTPIGKVAARARVLVCGRIAYVEVSSQQGPAQLVARIDDGTGVIDAIFMGRRIIPGISAGQRIAVVGRVVDDNGILRMYNPRYELTCLA